MIPEVSYYFGYQCAEYGWISHGTRVTLLTCLFYSPLYSPPSVLASCCTPCTYWLKTLFPHFIYLGAPKQCDLNLISNVMWVILPPKKVPWYSICLESMSWPAPASRLAKLSKKVWAVQRAPTDLEGIYKYRSQLSISLDSFVAISLPIPFSPLSRMSLTLKELISSSFALNNKPTVMQEFYWVLI